MARKSLAKRIEIVAKALDAVKPGWAEKVDLDKLDMDEPDACVLGQAYHADHLSAPYSHGICILADYGIPRAEAHLLLGAKDTSTQESNGYTGGIVTPFWVKEIEKRTPGKADKVLLKKIAQYVVKNGVFTLEEITKTLKEAGYIKEVKVTTTHLEVA